MGVGQLATAVGRDWGLNCFTGESRSSLITGTGRNQPPRADVTLPLSPLASPTL